MIVLFFYFCVCVWHGRLALSNGSGHKTDSISFSIFFQYKGCIVSERCTVTRLADKSILYFQASFACPQASGASPAAYKSLLCTLSHAPRAVYVDFFVVCLTQPAVFRVLRLTNTHHHYSCLKVIGNKTLVSRRVCVSMSNDRKTEYGDDSCHYRGVNSSTNSRWNAIQTTTGACVQLPLSVAAFSCYCCASSPTCLGLVGHPLYSKKTIANAGEGSGGGGSASKKKKEKKNKQSNPS